MARKILNIATLGLAGQLIGKKKSTTAVSTAAAPPTTPTSSRPKPIITPLGEGNSAVALLAARQRAGIGGSLSGKLGS